VTLPETSRTGGHAVSPSSGGFDLTRCRHLKADGSSGRLKTGLIQRLLQSWLIALQQLQRFRPLRDDVDMNRAGNRFIHAYLDLAQVGGLHVDSHAWLAVSRLQNPNQRWRNLIGGCGPASGCSSLRLGQL
jgi:hypothetical protein